MANASRGWAWLAAWLALAAMAPALAQQCPQWHCDCAAIADAQRRQACLAKEQQLQAQCPEQPAGTFQCAWHGPAATAVPLAWVSPSEPPAASESQADKLRESLEAQQWSVAMDLTLTEKLLAREDYVRARLLRQNRDQDMAKEHLLRWQLAAVLTALDEADDAEELWAEAGATSAERAGASAASARADWVRAHSDAVAAEQVAALKALALQTLINAGNEFERAGDAWGHQGAHDRAAVLWQQAAEIGAEVVQWQRELGQPVAATSRARVRARWYRSAYHRLAGGESDAAAAAEASAKRWAAAG